MSAAARMKEAPPFNIWPAPDMAILTGGRISPPAMPSALFGRTWGLLTDLADGAGAPVDYVAVGLLATAASLIGGKRRIRPYEIGSWEEPCILWLAAVGDPSSNKSPALDAATGPLRGMENDHAEDHEGLVRAWEAQAQRAKVERKAWEADVEAARKERIATPPVPDEAVMPDEPQRRRLLVQDSTPEALAGILSGNPFGTLHLRDELAGWWSSFDRYSPGGREFWLEAFGGRPLVVDRKGAKAATRIAFNGVSVLGGVQPEKLSECLFNGADDGLVPRFIWAWPDAVPYHRPRRIADPDRLEAVYRRLDGLRPDVALNGDPRARVLSLSHPASEIFEAWVAEHKAGLGDAASLFKSFAGKLQGAVLRLALVSELLAWADSPEVAEPREVSKATLVAAIEFVEDYCKPTALRVFGDASLPPVERNAAALARHIIKSRSASVNARDIRRTSGLPMLRRAEDVAEAIALLVDADWLRPAGTRAGETPGRQRADYLVNPGVLGALNE